jgi:hypothetical protein
MRRSPFLGMSNSSSAYIVVCSKRLRIRMVSSRCENNCARVMRPTSARQRRRRTLSSALVLMALRSRRVIASSRAPSSRNHTKAGDASARKGEPSAFCGGFPGAKYWGRTRSRPQKPRKSEGNRGSRQPGKLAFPRRGAGHVAGCGPGGRGFESRRSPFRLQSPADTQDSCLAVSATLSRELRGRCRRTCRPSNAGSTRETAEASTGCWTSSSPRSRGTRRCTR